MGLSDYDSGRFPGGHRANINLTCSFLNQYMKKNGSFEDLNFAFNKDFDLNGAPPTKTMNYLPMIEKAGQIPEVQKIAEKPEPEKAQMTIFYAGKVIVFDDFPADKVDDIISLATGGKTKNTNCSPTSMVPTAPNMVTPAVSIAPLVHQNLSTRMDDIPIARKISLTRFLEKRKSRIIAKAPYQKSNNGETSKKSVGFNSAV